MDTSKTYIDMCKHAIELQKLWNITVGDYYVNQIGDIKVVTEFGASLCMINNYKECLWIPRIDQLIELSGEGWRQFVEMCDYETFDTSPSLEIRGLERLMYIKYNKLWNSIELKWKYDGGN